MKDKKHIVEDKEARQKQASDIFHKHFDPWFHNTLENYGLAKNRVCESDTELKELLDYCQSELKKLLDYCQSDGNGVIDTSMTFTGMNISEMSTPQGLEVGGNGYLLIG